MRCAGHGFGDTSVGTQLATSATGLEIIRGSELHPYGSDRRQSLVDIRDQVIHMLDLNMMFIMEWG